MTRSMHFVFLSTLVFAAACAPQPVDLAAAADKLAKRDAEWSALAAAGQNADTVASYWTTDAVLYPTGQPAIVGRSALRNYVAENFKLPGFKIQWTSDKPVLSPDGKMGYVPGNTTVTVPGPQGKPLTLYMHGISVWRVDADGVWRCVVDITNEAPAPKS